MRWVKIHGFTIAKGITVSLAIVSDPRVFPAHVVVIQLIWNYISQHRMAGQIGPTLAPKDIDEFSCTW